MTTSEQRGAANRRKGHKAEVDLANWLASTIFPRAKRAVMTGHGVRGTQEADPGDSFGTPGLVWSVKNYSPDTIERNIPKWLDELDQMVGIGDQLGGLPILVVKRAGKASPADWWSFMRLAYLPASCSASPFAVRLRLGDLVELLSDAGYGEKV